MVNLPDKNNCCGCTACIEICPQKTISAGNIEDGFMFPYVDEEKCIGCKLCERTCPIKQEKFENPFIQEYYAFSNKDIQEKILSSSGGAFYMLALEVLSQRGYVFGAVLDENLKVVHICANDIETVKKMRGSKYLQSDISECFAQIADKLLLNVPVLFSGTPCQCDAVKNFLINRKISDKNLILCDLICHGVVSPQVFDDYIAFCEKKVGKKVIYHNFRSKINGWHTHTEENIFEDGSRDYKTYESQVYKKIFYSHAALRKSCFNCRYANLNRISDITIGDYWGIGKYHPELDDNTGTSSVIINSQKGKELFEKLRNIAVKQLSKAEIMQPQLERPAMKPQNYNKFWKIYNKKGFEAVLVRFYNYKAIGKIYSYIRLGKRAVKKLCKIVVNPVRKLLKKID